MVECAVGFQYILQHRYIKIKQVLQINFLKDRNRFGSGNKLAVTCDRSLFPGTKRRTKFLGTKILRGLFSFVPLHGLEKQSMNLKTMTFASQNLAASNCCSCDLSAVMQILQSSHFILVSSCDSYRICLL